MNLSEKLVSAFPAFPEGKFRMPLNSCHKPFSRHFYCFNQTIRPHSRSFKNWSQLLDALMMAAVYSYLLLIKNTFQEGFRKNPDLVRFPIIRRLHSVIHLIFFSCSGCRIFCFQILIQSSAQISIRNCSPRLMPNTGLSSFKAS